MGIVVFGLPFQGFKTSKVTLDLVSEELAAILACMDDSIMGIWLIASMYMLFRANMMC